MQQARSKLCRSCFWKRQHHRHHQQGQDSSLVHLLLGQRQRQQQQGMGSLGRLLQVMGWEALVKQC
jgi:hypothetical protein